MVASQYEPAPVAFLNVQEIVIPAGAKPLLLQQLSDIGMTRKSLFPDLDGLSDFINWEVRQKAARWVAPVPTRS